MLRGYWSLRLAWAHFASGIGRFALSILAIALGVALVVAIQLMNAAVLQSFLDTSDAMAGRAALTVTAGDGVTFPETLADTVSRVPGVRVAVPLVTAVAFPDDGTGEMLTVFGVDLANDADVRVYYTSDDPTAVVDDLLIFLSQPDSIVLGKEFAARRGLHVDDPLTLVTPQGRRRFMVRGLLEAEGTAKTLGGRLVVMDVYAAQRAFAVDGQVHQLDLVLADGADVEVVKRAVAAVLPPTLRVEEPALRKDVIRRTVASFQGMLTAFALLSVLAGYVICFSRLRAVFASRTWEVGLLRATGLTRLAVFVELLKESALLGVLGTGLGLPLGAVIGRLGLPLVAMATAVNFRWPVPVAAAGIQTGTLFLGAAVGLGAAVMAAALPALELARTQPAAALRLRGRASAPPPSWRGRIMVPALLMAIGVLAILQQRTHVAALGHATTVAVVLAAWGLAMPLVTVGGRLLLPVWRRMFGSAGEFAAGHVGEQARRAALTIATLGVGLGVVLMFGLLAGSFERTLVWKLSRRMRADLIVTSALYGGGYLPARLSDVVSEAIREIRGVKTVAGQLRTDTRFRNELRVLDVYDAAYFDARQRLSAWPMDPDALPNALDRVASGDGVLVSDSFAAKFQTRAGDSIELQSPLGPRSFRVVGVTRGELETAIIMDRHTYQRLWNDPTLTWIHIGVDDPANIPSVADAVRRQLGEKYRLRVQTTRELVAFFRDQARRAFSSTYLMEAIIFALVSVAIADMLASGVAEHIRLFAMLRAMGMTRAGVFAIVGLEGLALATLGLVLAVPTGLALGMFWVDVEFPALLGWRLDLHVPTVFLMAAAVLTMILCLLASLVPSFRAAYLSVPAALRNE